MMHSENTKRFLPSQPPKLGSVEPPAPKVTSLLLNVWIFSRLRGSGETRTFGLMARGAIASALSQATNA